MVPTDKPNPFLLLGLPTTATRQEIVERGQELCDLADSESARGLYRWALEQLITNPQRRLEYELFELPDAVYENAEWERFCRIHSRLPNRPDPGGGAAPPTVADVDLGALMDLVLEDMLQWPEPDPSQAAAFPPFDPGPGPPPLEITDVLFG